jgi:hypothetical protein
LIAITPVLRDQICTFRLTPPAGSRVCDDRYCSSSPSPTWLMGTWTALHGQMLIGF